MTNHPSCSRATHATTDSAHQSPLLAKPERQSEPKDGPPAPAAVVLDPVVLQTLREMTEEGAADMLAQLIECYICEAPKLLQTIKEAIAESDAVGLNNAAHVLKAGSASFGATVLSDLCRELETIGHNQTMNRAGALLPQLELELERVKTALQAEFSA